MIYVDGLNCMTCEPRHPDFSRDIEKYDHKYNVFGLTYEIRMHLFWYRLIWINGPFKFGGNSDRGNFTEQGLRDKLKNW